MPYAAPSQEPEAFLACTLSSQDGSFQPQCRLAVCCPLSLPLSTRRTVPQPPDPLEVDMRHRLPAVPSACGSPLEKRLPVRSARFPAAPTASPCVISFPASGSHLLRSSCSAAGAYASALAVLSHSLLCPSLVSLGVGCPLLCCAACSEESFPTSCRLSPQSLCPPCIRCLSAVTRGPCSCSAL